MSARCSADAVSLAPSSKLGIALQSAITDKSIWLQIEIRDTEIRDTEITDTDYRYRDYRYRLQITDTDRD